MMKLSHLSVVAFALSATAYAGSTRDHPRVQELKEQIRAVSLDNLGRTDNTGETLSVLQSKIDELASYNRTSRSAIEEIERTAGAWKQIFSDDATSFDIDPDDIYQVVLTNGYFYNFGSRADIPGVESALKGQYSPSGTALDIEFVQFGLLPTPRTPQTDLEVLAKEIDSGAIELVDSPFPGPIGVRGKIKNLYIDDEFRIAQGQNLRDDTVSIYILDRVQYGVRYLD